MRVTPWGRVVILSAVLVAGGVLALVAGGLATREQRVVSYPVTGAVDQVSLDLGDAPVEIVGGAHEAVDVQRRETFSYGHATQTQRTVTGGVFQLRSRCPGTVPDACDVSYRVLVPDNVPVEVRTTSGPVTMRDYQGSARVTTVSGDIDVRAFCGFSLQAEAQSGDLGVQAACPLQRLALRASSGAIRATVPDGRYRIDAQSAGGLRTVRGLTSLADAPFSISALSSSGDVLVERGA